MRLGQIRAAAWAASAGVWSPAGAEAGRGAHWAPPRGCAALAPGRQAWQTFVSSESELLLQAHCFRFPRTGGGGRALPTSPRCCWAGTHFETFRTRSLLRARRFSWVPGSSWSSDTGHSLLLLQPQSSPRRSAHLALLPPPPRRCQVVPLPQLHPAASQPRLGPPPAPQERAPSPGRRSWEQAGRGAAAGAALGGRGGASRAGARRTWLHSPACPERLQPPLGGPGCPPPARVGGRWVSAKKVNEDGGLSERLTRPGPPAPWTRRAQRRPSPPPGKRPGGGAGAGTRGVCGAPGRTPDGGAGHWQQRSLRAGRPHSEGKGVVYFLCCGRCPGDSVRRRPEPFYRARVCVRARALSRVPAGRAPPEPPQPLGPRSGGKKTVEARISDSSPVSGVPASGAWDPAGRRGGSEPRKTGARRVV